MVEVFPGLMRYCSRLAMVAVGGVGAWIWFGAAGAALVGLWCAAAQPWRAPAFTLMTPERFRSVEAWRVVCCDGEQWVEVYRDEVTAEQWNELLRSARAANAGSGISQLPAEAHPVDRHSPEK